MSDKPDHLRSHAAARAPAPRARRSGRRPFCSTASPRKWASGLSAVLRQFERAADLGTPTDALRRALAAQRQDRQRRRRDVGTAQSRSLSPPTRRRCRSPMRSLDLVVSALALQFVNDLPGTLIQIRRALKPDGLLLAAMLGGDTLTELREAFAEAESEIEGGISPRVVAFRRHPRSRRAAAARRLRAAGDRQRPADGALRQSARADARSARAWARPTC